MQKSEGIIRDGSQTDDQSVVLVHADGNEEVVVLEESTDADYPRDGEEFMDGMRRDLHEFAEEVGSAANKAKKAVTGMLMFSGAGEYTWGALSNAARSCAEMAERAGNEAKAGIFGILSEAAANQEEECEQAAAQQAKELAATTAVESTAKIVAAATDKPVVKSGWRFLPF